MGKKQGVRRRRMKFVGGCWKPMTRAEVKQAKERELTARRRDMPYSEYLRSGWWQAKRKQKGNSVGWKCERCGAGGCEIQIHHLHYRTLWREKNRDLQALCAGCHSREHEGRIEGDRHLDSIARQRD